MDNCKTYIATPQIPDPCNGTRVDAGCVIDTNAYIDLGISSNSSQEDINQASYSAIQSVKTTTDELQIQIDDLVAPNGSETKVTQGTNVTVTGNGTIATPYVINSTVVSTIVEGSTNAVAGAAVFDALVLKVGKFIKSDEVLTGAQRKDDVIYGILDQYTGEEITLVKTVGTPVVDGVIYFQLGDEYFQRVFDEMNPKWFGAKGDGITDDTVAIQKAITAAASSIGDEWWITTTKYDVSRRVLFPSAFYKINGTVLLPRGVNIDLGKSTLVGTGFTALDNIMFDGGYFNVNGDLVSNWQTSPESNRLVATSVTNGRITNCGIGFRIWNFNESCVLGDLQFIDCRQSFKLWRPFYSKLYNIFTRGSAGDTEDAAYEIANYPNTMDLSGVYVAGRKLGWVIETFVFPNPFESGAQAFHLKDIGAESCEVGMIIGGNIRGLKITSGYFEKNDLGLRINSVTSTGLSLDNCFFGECLSGIELLNVANIQVDESNVFLGCTKNISVGDNTFTYAKIDIQTKEIAINTLPLKDPLYDYTDAVDINQTFVLKDTVGNVKARQNFTGNAPVKLNYSGKSGFVGGSVPFCIVTFSGGTSFDVIIDTAIAYEDYSFLVVKLDINDNINAYKLVARIVGTDVFYDIQGGGKTITCLNNSGLLRLVVSSFNHPSGTAAITGVVRIV